MPKRKVWNFSKLIFLHPFRSFNDLQTAGNLAVMALTALSIALSALLVSSSSGKSTLLTAPSSNVLEDEGALRFRFEGAGVTKLSVSVP